MLANFSDSFLVCLLSLKHCAVKLRMEFLRIKKLQSRWLESPRSVTPSSPLPTTCEATVIDWLEFPKAATTASVNERATFVTCCNSLSPRYQPLTHSLA